MILVDVRNLIITIFLLGISFSFLSGITLAGEGKPRLRIEVFLSRGQQDDAEIIRAHFNAISETNIHFQFFRAGNPPANIAIGQKVPAPVARLAMQLAVEYGQGVDYLLPEELLPLTWIGIGTSAFDEVSQIRITPKDLAALGDPMLSNEQFHILYQNLTHRPK